MRPLVDPGGLAAEQDVNDLPRAVPLVPLPVQPDDRGQELLRGHGAVPDLRRGEAGVTIPPGPGPLGEVREQLGEAANRRLPPPPQYVPIGLPGPAGPEGPRRGAG